MVQMAPFPLILRGVVFAACAVLHLFLYCDAWPSMVQMAPSIMRGVIFFACAALLLLLFFFFPDGCDLGPRQICSCYLTSSKFFATVFWQALSFISTYAGCRKTVAPPCRGRTGNLRTAGRRFMEPSIESF